MSLRRSGGDSDRESDSALDLEVCVVRLRGTSPVAAAVSSAAAAAAPRASSSKLRLCSLVRHLWAADGRPTVGKTGASFVAWSITQSRSRSRSSASYLPITGNRIVPVSQ